MPRLAQQRFSVEIREIHFQ